MLSINLLPAEEKQMIRMWEAARAVGFFAMLALFVLATGLLFLLPSAFFAYLAARELQRSFEIEQRAGAQQREVLAVLAEARKTQEAIAEIKSYAARPAGVSRTLERFFPVSRGVTIISLAIRGDGGVTVEGRAGTREELLTFEETLRASDQFLEVSFPLKNIVRERNIHFSVKAKLKPAYQF